jgi:hypothetical protein
VKEQRREDSVSHRLLLPAMKYGEVVRHLHFDCVQEERGRADEIEERFRVAAAQMEELRRRESGLPDTIVVESPPEKLLTRLEQITSDVLFRRAFAAVPISIAIVEIDRLVAPQRTVNLDYVAHLNSQLSSEDLDALVEFCLVQCSSPPAVKVLQVSNDEILFSSHCADLRLLGGFSKPVGSDDLAWAHVGGQPTSAVTLLLGFGAAPVNAWRTNTRLVLNNGFHRACVLRSRGISRMPIVVQHVSNAELQIPDDELFGLSRDYLLRDARPVLMKDFFNPMLTLDLGFKPRLKTIRLRWGADAQMVPSDYEDGRGF